MESLDLVSPHLFRYKGKNFVVQEGKMPQDLDKLRHLEVRPTDVYIVAFPKSGTLWMQQILVQIMDEAHPELAEDDTNRNRVPWMEGGTIDDCQRDRPDPRLNRTHIPPDMLPLGVKEKRAKTIYLMRNPKDVLVSLYHFSGSWVMLETPTSFNQFFDDFMEGKTLMGSWFDHIREYYNEKDEMNLHYVMYEDMLKDTKGEVQKICKFLEKDLSDEAIDRVVESSTFDNMKTNPKANFKDLLETGRYRKDKPTMRSGKAGDWKNHFTVAQNEYFDKVFQEKMEGIPLNFTWEVKP
ncbi:amine sulfotransferase-like [Neosynchiropus ocellatus]